MRHSSRKCGLRRELEQPRGGVATDQRHGTRTQSPGPPSTGSARNQAESLHRRAMRSTPGGRERFAGSVSCQSVGCRESVLRPPPPAGHGLRSASAVAARKSPPRRLARRRTPGTQIRRHLCALRSLAAFIAVKPNPSLEARPNIKMPGPHSGLAHFPPCGPVISLPVPPQLER